MGILDEGSGREAGSENLDVAWAACIWGNTCTSNYRLLHKMMWHFRGQPMVKYRNIFRIKCADSLF